MLKTVSPYSTCFSKSPFVVERDERNDGERKGSILTDDPLEESVDFGVILDVLVSQGFFGRGEDGERILAERDIGSIPEFCLFSVIAFMFC